MQPSLDRGLSEWFQKNVSKRIRGYRTWAQNCIFLDARGGRTPKGAFNAETETDRSSIGISGNRDNGGGTDYFRDRDNHVATGDGERRHRKKDRPAVR